MPTPQIPKVSSEATLDELRDGMIGTQRYLTYLLSTLDTLNINRLDAKVIIAESITAGKLAADSVETKNIQSEAITTEKINAGAVTADKITVGQLSAITADLGHITAGLIESIELYGSYISTRRNAFPRAEMNNSGDLLAVYTDSSNYLTIEPGISNEPTITFRNGGDVIMILGPAFGLTGLLANTSIVLGTQSGLTNLVCGSSGFVTVPSWDKLLNSDTAVTLQDELDAIWAALAGKSDVGHTHSVTIPNHNHGNTANTTSGGGTFTVS